MLNTTQYHNEKPHRIKFLGGFSATLRNRKTAVRGPAFGVPGAKYIAGEDPDLCI